MDESNRRKESESCIMKALITGANGMLGQDLCPTLMDNGYDVIETDIQTLDITDIDMVREVLNKEKPDIVVHCAAYTNVDKAEEEVEKAELINVKGTENIAKICAEIDSTLVYISTDYVFDGTKKEAYLPSDIPNPQNVYGRTKLEGELAVREYCEKFYIARTSWLYGIHGKNFVETMIAIAGARGAFVEKDPKHYEGDVGAQERSSSTTGAFEPIKVVDDQIGCPTWTMDLSDGIVKLLEGKDYGIYHLCGAGSTSWYGFAKEIFELAGLKVNLIPCTTDEFPRPAKRPKNSIMKNNGILRDWKKALRDYMNLREV